MPRLIKNISAEIIEESISTISFNSINGQLGLEDYVKVYNFTGFLQNFLSVYKTEELLDLRYYGIISNNNKTFTEIEISY